MNVYIEYVIIDNLVITALICVLSCRILKMRPDKLKTSLAAVTGTAAAVTYPFLRMHFLWLLLIKAGLFAILSIILFYKKVRLYKGASVFLMVTALFGGFIFMIAYIALGDAQAALLLPAYDFPFGVILLLPVGAYYLLKGFISGIAKRRAEADFSFQFDITVMGKTVSATGFLDSGNLLCDEKTGLPVIVAGALLTTGLLTENQFELILRGRGEQVCKGARYLKFNTISREERILAVPAENFKLYLGEDGNILKEVMLGLSFKRLGTGCDALLSPLVF